MFGYFYNERIRKSVAAFGKLFNNIYILRQNSSGAGVSTEKVPLTYAPRRKFLDRIRENADLDQDTKVAIKLPRMSFEIIAFQYDQQRQVTRTNRFATTGTSDYRRIWSPVPYNINFQLNIYAKTHDEALQVVEQIIPYFNPQYTLTVKPLAGFPDVKEDIPLTLTDVSFTDDYEGAMEQRRSIIYTLNFDMAVNFYGPTGADTADAGLIRKAIISIYNQQAGLADSDILLETITVEPDPADAEPDSDYGFTETIELAYLNDSA